MPAPSPWPSLRTRASSLFRDVYAELVTEGATRALSRLPPPAAEGGQPAAAGDVEDDDASPTHPEMGVATSSALWTLSVLVSGIGALESALSHDALPCREVREATAAELRAGVGTLGGRDFLPSAYDPWVGPRAAGMLRLRYGYDAARLAGLTRRPELNLTPIALDAQTEAWVRAKLARPAAASRLAVWRALKRRLYHYDAGVLAFHAFPRNYLLSPDHWQEMLQNMPTGCGRVALDVGAGDGSLCSPYAPLFTAVAVTELTAPLCWRLKGTPAGDAKLETYATAELTPKHLGGRSLFDVAFCLNVLDRCKDPARMLDQMRALLPPQGWLVVSVVLPPLQSDAATTVGSSQRRWRVTGSDFESAAASLIHTLLAPAGFAPRRLVRVPYFCAGDRYSPVAVLDAALIVLEKAEEGTAHGAAAQGAALGARNGSAAAQGAGRPDGDEAASARRPAAGASPDGEGGAVVRGAGATRVGAEAPRRAVSSPRPSLLAPTPRPHRASFPLPDSTASSDHAHVDETRCDDCDALDGYRFGDK